MSTVIHLFTESSLRIHDNPSFAKSLKSNLQFRAVYVFDPYFQTAVSGNVWKFFCQCLHDLDSRLRSYDIRLQVFKGSLLEVLRTLIAEWNVAAISYQPCQSRYEASQFESGLTTLCSELNVQTWKEYAQTLYDPEQFLQASGNSMPSNYKDFQNVLQVLGRPPNPVPTPDAGLHILGSQNSRIAPPHPLETSIEELYPGVGVMQGRWVGGETQALGRLSSFCQERTSRLKTQDSLALLMGKESLSPYFRFGCLSVRLFCSRIYDFGSASYEGQQLFNILFKNLLLREFSYQVGGITPNFGNIQGNPYCLAIPWESRQDLVEAFHSGKTGFPWIDAIIRQIVSTGWAHHLCRRSLAVFLTRGLLWVSWEIGRDFFMKYMLDFEFPVSTVCWMQDSCSGFFHWNADILDPILVGKQLDPDGMFTKHYVPELKNFPVDYLHSPWNAPRSLQQQAGCIIGEDYPRPVLDPCEQSELCCRRLQFISQKLEEMYSHEFAPGAM